MRKPVVDGPFLLKSVRCDNVTSIMDPDKRTNTKYLRLCVEQHECTLEMWHASPWVHEVNRDLYSYAANAEVVYGRGRGRVVELFIMNDGKETPALRRQLVSHGFEVLPPLLVDPAYAGYRDYCKQHINDQVANQAKVYQSPMPAVLLADTLEYGTIVDSDCPPRALRAVVVEMSEFKQVTMAMWAQKTTSDEEPVPMEAWPTITANGVSYPVIGFHRNGTTGFLCGDEDLPAWFGGQTFEILWNNRLHDREITDNGLGNGEVATGNENGNGNPAGGNEVRNDKPAADDEQEHSTPATNNEDGDSKRVKEVGSGDGSTKSEEPVPKNATRMAEQRGCNPIQSL
ncbi:hypothetical protein K470DRAFT_257433 [Piedraia hortae CBS 480.64]|uniref:Uncharacterized protein n=1 Tax=Piedraia hortae CBS 480.64 TaxID=1314780 RepID=A0A6A7C0P9_9PEZI|nr:hypothetical protein K470DRAFT_257433 [Piedraia hortae CBS 480.64]